MGWYEQATIQKMSKDHQGTDRLKTIRYQQEEGVFSLTLPFEIDVNGYTSWQVQKY